MGDGGAQPNISPELLEAVTLHEQGQVEKAEALYDKILKKDPNNAHVLHFKGVLCLNRQEHAEALRYLGLAIALNPGNASYYSNLGEVYRARGDAATAINAYNIALGLDPAMPMALMNKGIALRSLAAYAQSISCFEAALAAAGNGMLDAVVCMAVTYRDAGDLHRARLCCGTVLQSDPDHSDAKVLLAEVDAIVDQHGGATTIPAKPAVSHIADGIFKKVTALHSDGKFEESIKECLAGLELVPHHIPISLQLALSYEARGSLDMAIARIQGCVSDDGSGAVSEYDKLAYYLLSRLLFLAGRLSECQALRKAVGAKWSIWEDDPKLTQHRTEIAVFHLMSKALETPALSPHTKPGAPALSNETISRPLAVVGDSHVYSWAWQHLKIGGETYTCVPYLCTGLKAWHVRPESDFVTHFALKNLLAKVPDQQPIILSCGEIDCRWEEGIGHAVRKNTYPNNVKGVEATVEAYARGVTEIVAQRKAPVYILTVSYPRQTLIEEHPKLRELTQERHELVSNFNAQLRIKFTTTSPQLIDVSDSLAELMKRDSGKYAWDGVHASEQVVKLAEKALQDG